MLNLYFKGNLYLYMLYLKFEFVRDKEEILEIFKVKGCLYIF